MTNERSAVAHGVTTLPNLRGEHASQSPFRGVFGRTHVGHRRSRNEDHFLVLDVERCVLIRQSSLEVNRGISGTVGSLVVVADGMGGHSNGELASAITLDTLVSYVARSMPMADASVDVQSALRTGFQAAALECQRRMREAAVRKGQPTDLGTTLTAVYAVDRRAEIVHVGDSRAYLLRNDGRLLQLTRDHTVAGQLSGTGQEITGRFANLLTNSIGGRGEDAPNVDGGPIDLVDGDKLLVCTDGLTKHLDDATIEQTLFHAETAESAVDALVDATLETEASDNVTAVVAYV